ncbi:HU family DNA-binding protein [Candidatus Liberibacter sp.]|uniref:HU family DNA-binding protein n=1 Tax=Candidatus Liberibacter sp. TaxID=34022 RepID=UPI0015F4F83F|nr:HU family DNA-binding protein [Candidatus Liberibacter sp.]MBA5723916.1 integration host factor subunit beta [Candidatus Liberibacter sp.]
MIKSDLIDIIAKRYPHITHANVKDIVDTLLEEMSSALASGGRVELRGFGSFAVKKRAARMGIAPHTREVISIGEKWVPFFRSGKNLKQRLNPSLPDDADSDSDSDSDSE